MQTKRKNDVGLRNRPHKCMRHVLIITIVTSFNFYKLSRQKRQMANVTAVH